MARGVVLCDLCWWVGVGGVDGSDASPGVNGVFSGVMGGVEREEGRERSGVTGSRVAGLDS